MDTKGNEFAVATNGITDALKKFREENDPQTVFYLNAISADPTKQRSIEVAKQDILTTEYFWATKIEQTVQTNLGNAKERFSTQKSWERASYRSKLVDYLAKTTPWMILVENTVDPAKSEALTGEYHHDKSIFQNDTQDFLDSKIPEIPRGKLNVIANYITEILLLSDDKFIKPLQFAVVFPLPTQPGLRILHFVFELKTADANTVVAFTRSVYRAGINKKAFDGQKLDQKLLELGKSIVQDWTLDVVI